MKQKIKYLFVHIAFLLSFAFSISAQTVPANPSATPPPKSDEEEVIKVDSRLVVIPVSVTDSKGQPVLGLTAQDFSIDEENRRQEVAQVSDAEKVPLEIALLFDVSASTDAMFNFEQETAAQFLRDVMRPEDRATIFTIGEQPILIQPRDSSEKAAIAVKIIQPTKQFTAFYDTVHYAADYLRKNSPEGRRKVIVVISDGEDTNSVGIQRGFGELYDKLGSKMNTLNVKMLEDKRNEIKRREQTIVLQALQNADTVFYSINPAGSSYQLNKISQFGQSNLQTFADDTGGTAFLPKFRPIDTKDNLQNSSNVKDNQTMLTKIFQQLASELQAQYLVQYYSEGEFPSGKYIKLSVGLTSSNKHKVRARQGYFVKN